MTELLIEHKKTQRWHPLGFFYSVLGRWLKPKADYHLFVSVQPFADIVGKIRFALLVSKHYFVILFDCCRTHSGNRKGVYYLDLIISFLVSVMAGVTSYYICKWLDGNDSDN